MRKRPILLIAVVVLYCAWAVSPARAHAVFARSNPAPNAILTQSPVQVEIYYTETLQPGLSLISVYDSNGQTVDLGDARIDASDATRMTVSLRALADGVYTVSWKALSTVDGHLTTGSFPFAVGNVSSADLAAVPPTNNFSLPFGTLIAKWLLLAALALLTSLAVFDAFIWSSALKGNESELPPEVRKPPTWAKLYQIGWIAVLFGLVVGLLSEAGQTTGNELALPWAAETNFVLTGSRLGLIWLIRLALVLIGIWLTQTRFASWKRWAGFAVGLALLFTISLTSHAATEPRPVLPILGDWLHQVGMSIWFGSLAYLLTGLRELQRVPDILRTRLTSLFMARFSTVALVSVGVVGVSGMYTAFLRVGSLNALDTTLYGHVLFFKQGFVAALLLLAATNLFFISPRLKRDRLNGASNIPLVMRFEKIVLVETILACMLLASVSLLTYLPPAKVVLPSSDLTGTANVDDLQIDLSISPGKVGQNTFTLHLVSNGQPLQSAKEVMLRFTPAQGNIPPSEVQLIGQGDGNFATKGSYLSLSGNWQVQAIVRRADKFDAYANFNFAVNPLGTENQDAATPKLAGGLLMLVGLLFGLLMFSIMYKKPVLRFGVGGVLGLLVIGLGVITMMRPPPANAQANPIVPDTKSVAAGQALFSNYCVPCHGESGKGDGPLGLTLNPRPADLSYHAIPGVHTDAQLFEWITNGVPGSRMPALKTVLSDTDRWNLVNFVRTLAPK